MKNRSFTFLLLSITIWFLLLTILPLAVMTFFVRRSLTHELYLHTANQSAQQAKTNAAIIERFEERASLISFIFSSQPLIGVHFVVDQSGGYIAHPESKNLNRMVQQDYSAEIISALTSGSPGYFLDMDSRKLGGYAPIAGSAMVDVIIVDFLEIEHSLALSPDVSTIFFVLITISIVAIVFGVIFWKIVVSPLQQLAGGLDRLILGDHDYNLDSGKSVDALQLLVNRFNQAQNLIKELINGAESRIQAEKLNYAALVESEDRYRIIFDSTSEAVTIHDPDSTTILTINEKFTELYGYKQDEVLSLNIGDLSSGDTVFTLRSALRWVRKAQMQGAQVVEWHAKAKDGHLFWVELTFRVIVINNISQLLLAARDVSERKRTEQMQIAVYRIFQAAQASQTVYELFTFIHGILENLLPAKNFIVALYDPRADLFTYPYHFDEHDAWPSIHRPDNGLITHVMRSGESLLATPNMLNTLGIEFDPDEKTHFVDWLGAPMKTTSGALGVIAIKNYNPAFRWTEQEKEIFTFLAAQIALAVERKRADDALRESEARWRTLMENTPQLILTFNRAGGIIFVNRAFHGFNRIQLASQSIFAYIPGGDSSQKQELLLKVFSDRSTVSFEIPIPLGDGMIGWFSCNISPVIDEGRVDLAIFNATDITDIKRAEEALRESEALYRRAIEAAGAVPYYRDRASNAFRFMGSGIQKITGYSNTEITPQIWNTLVEDVVMLGDASGFSFDKAIALAHAGELKIWQCDYRIRTRDGRLRWVYDSSLSVAGQDNPDAGSIGIMQDITERKLVEEALRQSEYRFRSIVEQLSEGFALIDENGRITEWNRALEKMLGIERQAVIGADFAAVTERLSPAELVQNRILRKNQQAFRRGLRTGKSILFARPIETTMITAYGQQIRAQQTIFPISTESGYRIGVLNRDVTEQKIIEEQIRKLNDELESRVIERTTQLENANKELEAFSYSISHDLRAPLRAIDGFSRILVDSLGSSKMEEAPRYLGLVRENAQQMGRLIDDLLSFSRLSRQPLKKLFFSSRNLVDQVLAMLMHERQNREIELLIGVLPVCQGDENLLKQVWVNLLSNAIKFTRRSQAACIEIGANQGQDETIFFVKDNGTGFDMRYVDKLFGVFQRLHRPEDFEGTGVGLAIVQRIVRRHGGCVWAESEVGSGATFYFSLPVEREFQIDLDNDES